MVKDTTEQPIEIIVDHHYTLYSVSFDFFDVRGTYPVTYNLTIYDSGGSSVVHRSGSLTVPTTVEMPATGDVGHLSSTSFKVNLSPGKYTVTCDSNDKVNYNVNQESKLAGAAIGMAVLGIIGVLVFVMWLYMSLQETDKKKAAQRKPLFFAGPQPGGSSSYTQTQASPTYSMGYGANPQGTYRSSFFDQPSTGTSQSGAQESNLEYRQGGAYTELMCSNCGPTVNSQPVNGILTCEHCGEKARLY